jgi:hypothetical protein
LHAWLLRFVGASTGSTSMALACRWRSRPHHQKRTFRAAAEMRYSINRLGLPMKNPINHLDLEGIVVNLVNISAVAQTKPSRPGFDPFERRLFYALLIFKNCVFLSVIVNDFKFVYRVSFSAFHSPSQVGE